MWKIVADQPTENKGDIPNSQKNLECRFFCPEKQAGVYYR
jgi:hypothetical protein